MEDLLVYLLSSSVCLLTAYLIIAYNKRNDYWNQLGIKGDPLFPLVSTIIALKNQGYLRNLLNKSFKYGKIFGTTVVGINRVVILDPEVVNQICVKEFDIFTNHENASFMNKYQKASIVIRQDEQWKHARSMISPSFTANKMKRITKLLEGCADDVVANVGKLIDESQASNSGSKSTDGAEIKLNDLFNRYSLDGITTCGYGMKLPSSNEASNAKSNLDELTRLCTDFLKPAVWRMMAIVFFPKFLLEWSEFDILPAETWEPLVDRMRKLIEIRRSRPGQHDDLMQSIVDTKFGQKPEVNELDKAESHYVGSSDADHLAKEHEMLVADSTKHLKQATENSKLDDLNIISDLTLFLVAGMHTTATLLTNTVYLLSHHEDIQEKLYEQLSNIYKRRAEPATGDYARTGSEFSYEELTNCHYLDACISESLRVLSPAILTDRHTKRDYYIEKYNARLKAGSSVLIAIQAIHLHPDYWQDPEKFDPTRFLPENRHNIIPGSYMPFGMGPRHCIGMRFALTEAKMGLAKLVMNYRFKPAPNTKYPLEDNFSLNLLRIKRPYVIAERRV